MTMRFGQGLLAALCLWLSVLSLSGAGSSALVRVAVAHVRENPSHAAEMGTQVLMGTPLKVAPTDNASWMKVETPDGYRGYVASNSLCLTDSARMLRWRHTPRVVVSSTDQTWLWTRDICDGDSLSEELQRVSDVVNGCILELDSSAEACEGYIAVRLPDGRRAMADEDDVEPLEQWAARPCSIDGAIDFARSMMGSTYLWGGTSSKGVDCSGLTKVAFLSQGIILPRNASQQARVGEPLPLADRMAFRPGDLLFFGNAATGRVNHVGIALGNGRFIHSSGRVRISSLIPGQAGYEDISLLGARRLLPAHLSRMALLNHPWYF